MRILLLFVSLVPVITGAGIYKYVNPDGGVEYSDQPREGAAKVEVAPLQTYTPPPLPKIKRLPEGKPQPGISYQISIASPQPGATVRENTGKVKVKLRVKPPLEVASKYVPQLLLDGQPVAKTSAGLHYTLANVDRGTHTLQARLLDPSGTPVAHSETVTFYMRRISILFRDNGSGQPGGVQRAPRAPQMPKMPGPPSPGGVPFP